MDKIIHIGNLYGPDRGTGYAGNIWGKQGLAPALTTMGGGMREPMIVEYENRPDDMPEQQG